MKFEELFHPDIAKVLHRSGIHTLEDLKNWMVQPRPSMDSEKFETYNRDLLFGYLIGHSHCLKAHYDESIINEMAKTGGKFDIEKYIVNALKDYKAYKKEEQ